MLSIILDIALVAIVLITVFICVRRGFFRTLVGFICMVAIIVLIAMYAKPFGGFINEKVVSPFLASRVVSQTDSSDKDDVTGDKEEALLGNELLNRLFGKSEKDLSDNMDRTDSGLKLKDYLVSLLLTSRLLRRVCICIAAVVIALGVRLAGLLVELLFYPALKKPALSDANKSLGFIFGLVISLVIICVFTFFVNIFMVRYTEKTDKGEYRTQVVENTCIYKYVEEYNPMNVIFDDTLE